MTNEQREFLERVRDGDSIYPLVKQIGYGWAIQAGLIREVRPSPPFLDFEITDAGHRALSTTKGGE